MNTFGRRGRSFLWLVCLCLALGAGSAGCESRRLSWQYVDKTPEQIAGARRVAFSLRVLPGGKGPAGADIEGAITAELLSRNYKVATKDTDADLILEFSARLIQQTITSTTSVPVPFVQKSHTKSEVQEQIHQISVNVIAPKDKAIVGMVSVQYAEPMEKPRAAVQDVMLGLDMIRRGRAPATVKLKGKPGQEP